MGIKISRGTRTGNFSSFVRAGFTSYSIRHHYKNSLVIHQLKLVIVLKHHSLRNMIFPTQR